MNSNVVDSVSGDNLGNLQVMGGRLLDYYFPDGKLDRGNLAVLHELDSTEGDRDIAAQILQHADDLQLLPEQVKKFQVIANGTILDRVDRGIERGVSFLKRLVTRSVSEVQTEVAAR